MSDEIDKLDGIDLVGAAEKIQAAMRDTKETAREGTVAFLGGFDKDVAAVLAKEIKEKTSGKATDAEVDEAARLFLSPTLVVPKGVYWFDESLDETVERLMAAGEEPTDDIRWTPHVTVGPKPNAEDKARSAAAKAAPKKRGKSAKPAKPVDSGKDCWSAHPEAIFFALMECSVRDYWALLDAKIIVDGKSIVNDWPRNKRGKYKTFCNDYSSPADVNDLLHYLRGGGLESDLAEMGSKITIEETLRKLGLKPMSHGPGPDTPESRLAAAMRNRKPAA